MAVTRLTRPGRPDKTEVAAVRDDVDIFAGWTSYLENPDQVLAKESAGRGVRIYEELERDWQVFSMLQTRSLAIQACEWLVEPASDAAADVRIAEYVEKVLREANFDRLSDTMMHAVLCGYKPVEVMWEASEGSVWISEFRGRRPSRFIFTPDEELRLLTLSDMIKGVPIKPRKIFCWSYGGRSHNPYGRGLGHQIYWPVWFKKNGVRFWVRFAEKFGTPTSVGRYPPGTDATARRTLLDAISAIEQETGVTIPDTMSIELLEATRTSSINTYQDLCDYMDKAISKIILGQTLTSEPGSSGSYSLGQVHNLVRRDILKSDADMMCEHINATVVRWLVDFNFAPTGTGQRIYPKVWRRTEEETDLQARAARDKIILVDMGMGARVPESYIEQTYDIPLAKDGEPTITPAPVAQPQPGLSVARPAAASASMAEAPTQDKFGQDMIDKMVIEGLNKASDELRDVIAPIIKQIKGAESLGEVAALLKTAQPQAENSPFSETLARAMFFSALTGYAAATQEVTQEPEE